MEAVLLIIGLEIFDVEKEINHALAVGGDIIQKLFCLLAEIEHIVDAGELIGDGDLAQVIVHFDKAFILHRLRAGLAVAGDTEQQRREPHGKAVDLRAFRDAGQTVRAVDGDQRIKLPEENQIGHRQDQKTDDRAPCQQADDKQLHREEGQDLLALCVGIHGNDDAEIDADERKNIEHRKRLPFFVRLRADQHCREDNHRGTGEKEDDIIEIGACGDSIDRVRREHVDLIDADQQAQCSDKERRPA